MKVLKSIYPFYIIGALYLIVNVILRTILLFHPLTQVNYKVTELIRIMAAGTLSDLFVYIIAGFLLIVYLLFLSDSKFSKPWGYVLFGIMLSLLLYVSFFNTILNEYGGVIPEIGISLIALKTVLFGLMLFLPKYRKSIRLMLYSVTVFLFVLVIVQNAVSEFFFWNEFGVRYNFIAVDYLIYTNTVIGNIMESYPVVPLFTGIGLITLLSTYFIVRKSREFLSNLPSFSEKMKVAVVYAAMFVLAIFAVPFLSKYENSQNIFNNELQANGLYKFYTAFNNSELDYLKFYKTIPEKEAFTLLKNDIHNVSDASTIHAVMEDQPEIHKNVVLITVESLSADFIESLWE